MSMLKFDLQTQQIAVELGGQQYTLVEMRAAERDRHLDNLASRMRVDATGRPCGIKRFESMQADLLTLCLRDPEGKPVPTATIQSWPGSVVSQLFDEAQKMNRLTEREEVAVGEEIKNG